MFFFDEKGLFIAKLSQLFSFVTCYTDANIFPSSKKKSSADIHRKTCFEFIHRETCYIISGTVFPLKKTICFKYAFFYCATFYKYIINCMMRTNIPNFPGSANLKSHSLITENKQ